MWRREEGKEGREGRAGGGGVRERMQARVKDLVQKVSKIEKEEGFEERVI